MGRPGDWSPLGMHNDPTPGDPDVLRALHTEMETLGDLAREVNSGLDRVLSNSQDGFVGRTAEAVRGRIDGHLKGFITALDQSFAIASPATLDYANAMQDAQAKADQALSGAQGLDKKDPALDAFRHQAQAAGDEWGDAAVRYSERLEEAGRLIQQPADKWKILMMALGILALILSILGAIFGGWVGLLALAVNVALLIKTAIDFAQGRASGVDLVLAIVGVLFPSTKGMNVGQLYKGIFSKLKGLPKTLGGGVKGLGNGITHLLTNPHLLTSIVTGFTKLPRLTLIGLRAIGRFTLKTVKVVVGNLKLIGGALANDFRIVTVGATSTLGKLGVYAVSFGTRFAVTATLPLDFFELGIGTRAAIKMGLGTRLGTPWARLPQPAFGGALHVGSLAGSGHLGLGATDLHLGGANGHLGGLTTGLVEPPGSGAGLGGLGGIGHGNPGGPGAGLGGLHTGGTGLGGIHLGPGVTPDSMAHTLGGLDPNSSLSSHLTALDHATGYDRSASGLLQPSAAHFGGIDLSRVGDMGGAGGHLGSAATGTPLGAGLGGLHAENVGARTSGLGLTANGSGLHTAIGDGMSGIRLAEGHVADFHALGLPEMRQLADGQLSVTKMSHEGITMRLGDDLRTATNLHMDFKSMSLTNDAGTKVVVAPEVHAALGTTDARTAGAAGTSTAPGTVTGLRGDAALPPAGATHVSAGHVDTAVPGGHVGETRLPGTQGNSLPGTHTGAADLRTGGGVHEPGGAEFRAADLKGADLKGADLRGSDLRGADLNTHGLTGGDLKAADIKGGDLKGADLKGADLKAADLNSTARGVTRTGEPSGVDGGVRATGGAGRGPDGAGTTTDLRGTGTGRAGEADALDGLGGGRTGTTAEAHGAEAGAGSTHASGVSAHDGLDLAGRRTGTGDLSGTAGRAPAAEHTAAHAPTAFPEERVAVRPEGPSGHGTAEAARAPRSRFEAITGGVGGRTGAERIAAWNHYEDTVRQAARTERELTDLGGGLDKPSENVDQAAAKLDAQQMSLAVDAAAQDLTRLHMDVRTIQGRLDQLTPPAARPGPDRTPSSSGPVTDAQKSADWQDFRAGRDNTLRDRLDVAARFEHGTGDLAAEVDGIAAKFSREDVFGGHYLRADRHGPEYAAPEKTPRQLAEDSYRRQLGDAYQALAEKTPGGHVPPETWAAVRAELRENASTHFHWVSERERALDGVAGDVERAVGDFRERDLFQGRYLPDDGGPAADAALREAGTNPLGAAEDGAKLPPASLPEIRLRTGEAYARAVDDAFRADMKRALDHAVTGATGGDARLLGPAGDGPGAAARTGVDELRAGLGGRVEQLSDSERWAAHANEALDGELARAGEGAAGGLPERVPSDGAADWARTSLRDDIRAAHAEFHGTGTGGTGAGGTGRDWDAFVRNATGERSLAARLDYAEFRDVRVTEGHRAFDEAVTTFERDHSLVTLSEHQRERLLAEFDKGLEKAVADHWFGHLGRDDFRYGRPGVEGGPATARSWNESFGEMRATLAARIEHETALDEVLGRSADDFHGIVGHTDSVESYRNTVHADTVDDLGKDFRERTVERYDQLWAEHEHDIKAWLKHEADHGDTFHTSLAERDARPLPRVEHLDRAPEPSGAGAGTAGEHSVPEGSGREALADVQAHAGDVHAPAARDLRTADRTDTSVPAPDRTPGAEGDLTSPHGLQSEPPARLPAPEVSRHTPVPADVADTAAGRAGADLAGARSGTALPDIHVQAPHTAGTPGAPLTEGARTGHGDGTRLDSNGPDGTRLDSAGPDTTSLDSTRLDATRLDATGSASTRLDTAGTDTTGLGTTPLDTTGLDTTGPDTTRLDTTAPDTVSGTELPEGVTTAGSVTGDRQGPVAGKPFAFDDSETAVTATPATTAAEHSASIPATVDAVRAEGVEWTDVQARWQSESQVTGVVRSTELRQIDQAVAGLHSEVQRGDAAAALTRTDRLEEVLDAVRNWRESKTGPSVRDAAVTALTERVEILLERDADVYDALWKKRAMGIAQAAPVGSGAFDDSALRAHIRDAADRDAADITFSVHVKRGAPLFSRDLVLDGMVGHAWVEIALPGGVAHAVSMYPTSTEGGLFTQIKGVKADIVRGTMHQPDVSLEVRISAADLARGLRQVEKSRSTQYQLFSNNSVTFARSMFRAVTGEGIGGWSTTTTGFADDLTGRLARETANAGVTGLKTADTEISSLETTDTETTSLETTDTEITSLETAGAGAVDLKPDDRVAVPENPVSESAVSESAVSESVVSESVVSEREVSPSSVGSAPRSMNMDELRNEVNLQLRKDNHHAIVDNDTVAEHYDALDSPLARRTVRGVAQEIAGLITGNGRAPRLRGGAVSRSDQADTLHAGPSTAGPS
uniref:pentapeptide repeat-containing protein n=1 Tax=Streptomyces corallincola TaxID=2851888 RepID=UPI002484BF75